MPTHSELFMLSIACGRTIINSHFEIDKSEEALLYTLAPHHPRSFIVILFRSIMLTTYSLLHAERTILR